MELGDRASATAVAKPGAAAIWVWLAFVTAVLTAAGSLALTLMDNKQACPLCFYQRAFALGLVAVLGQGLLTGTISSGRLVVLALPLAIGGLGVAAFHVSLEVRDILECPTGLFDVLTAPKQSLAMFAILTIVLAAGLCNGMKARQVSPLASVLALALRAGLVWAALS